MSMHRARPALLSLALVLVAGCGGSSDSDSGAAPDGSSAPPSSAAPAPFTTPAAQAAAEQINLKAADLPGFTAAPPDATEDSETEALEDEFATCAGASTVDPIAEFPSDDFTKGQDLPSLEISSDVSYAAEAAQIESDVKAFQGAKAESCIVTFVGKVLASTAGEGAEFASPKVTRLTPEAPGTVGAFGFSVSTAAMAEGASVPLTFDILGFGKGRAAVSLVLVGAGTPVPAAQRDALFATLVERASGADL